jgi:hypothetical protein
MELTKNPKHTKGNPCNTSGNLYDVMCLVAYCGCSSVRGRSKVDHGPKACAPSEVQQQAVVLTLQVSSQVCFTDDCVPIVPCCLS